jgi:hypothetical protein
MEIKNNAKILWLYGNNNEINYIVEDFWYIYFIFIIYIENQ